MFVRGTTWVLVVGVWMAGCSSSSSPPSDNNNKDNDAAATADDSSSGSGSGSSGDDGTSSPDGSPSSHDASSPADGSTTDAKASDAGHDSGTIVGADGAILTPVEDFCNRRCNRILSCAATLDAGSLDGGSDCVSSCNTGVATLTQYTGAYWEAVSSCLETASCVSVLGGQASMSCPTTAQTMLTPSAAVVSFCTQSTCPPADQFQDCQTQFSPYTDAAINSVSSCISTMGCAMSLTCVQNILFHS
jgi:hypothetical protein